MTGNSESKLLVLFLEAMFSKKVKLGFKEKMMVETLVVRYSIAIPILR